MRVMMLLKSDAKSEAGVVPDEKLLTEMGNYNESMVNAGVMVGGEGLHPSTHGARVRIVKGKTTIIDGPFAEAKEVVAGFFMLRTKSLQEAIDWAKRIPDADSEGEGQIELRPLFEREDLPGDSAKQQPSEGLAKPGPENGARYISFIHGDANYEAGAAPSEQLERMMSKMGGLIQEMREKDVLIEAEGLKPTKDAAKVFLSKNKRRVVDGPFTEAKEVIAGFTVYRAKTKAEAIEWARRCLQIHVDVTGVDFAQIEVRRVFEAEEIPVSATEEAGGWRDQEKRLRERLGN